MGGFGFGVALGHLRVGRAVRRQAWPSGAALVLVPSSRIIVDAVRPLGVALPSLTGEAVSYSAHLDKVQVDRESGAVRIESWTPSHDALMAEDWEVAR